MPIKTILVPLSGHIRDRRAVEHALSIARLWGAHVTALLPGGHLSVLVPTTPEETGTRYSSLIHEAQAHLTERTDAARIMVEEVARSTGCAVAETPGAQHVPTVVFEARRGEDSAVILVAAVLHDLLLFHRHGEGVDAASDVFDTLKSALQSAGRPLLLIPARLPEAIDTVAICWNGSIEGAHAVTAAMPFLLAARSVHILTAATTKTAVQRGEDLRCHLGWHGINAMATAVDANGSPVGEALLSKVTELGVDLVVMGGYSHNRVRQTLLGGVTHHVLRNAAVPVLLSR